MGGGRGMGIPLGVGGGGLGIVGILAYLLLSSLGGGGLPVEPGVDPFPAAPAAGEPLRPGGSDERQEQFVAFVVADVQDTWATLFQRAGRRYERTKLVLFDRPTSTGCGVGSPETGPFYCPADRRVYLELGFFRELATRFGAPGDFAQAYVIAHEFGHHVQNLLGIDDEVRRGQQQEPDQANELSVRLELQADCFAGVWGHSAYRQGQLSQGDLEEGIEAAASVGDDRIQRSTRGRVEPESFTHGSSEQRTRWFRRGFERGDPNACDTFSGDV